MDCLAFGGAILKVKDYHIVFVLRTETGSTEELCDYKLMCFNGKVKCCFTCTERWAEDGLKVTVFDNDWNILSFGRKYRRSTKRIDKPANYEFMVQLAEKLAEEIPFVRVDFYECNGKVYFSELTLYPACGFERFRPDEWDEKLGEWLKLPERG